MGQSISIAQNFSRYPAGRFRTDGPWSGQRFREEVLIPALHRGPVTLILDGVAGLPSSFFEEAIGGLIRAGLSFEELNKNLVFEAKTARMASYPEQGQKYLLDAKLMDDFEKSKQR
jgi:hypothetical protein